MRNKALWWLIVLLAAGAPLGAAAAASGRVATIERAEFIMSDSATPPADDAGWSPVALPHDWRTLGVHGRLTAWYRVRLELVDVPRSPQGILLRHLRSWSLELYVNRARHAGTRDLLGPGAQDYGYFAHWQVPAALWKRGENVLHFRMVGSADARHLHGLGRVRLAPLEQTGAQLRSEWELSGGVARYTFAAALAFGLVTFFLWLARRSDRVLFWFSTACLSWTLANVPNYWLRGHVSGWFLEMCNVYARFGMAVPAFILALRLVDRRWPRIEAAVWGFLLLEVTYYIWNPLLPAGFSGHWFLRVFWPTASAALLFAGAAVIARLALRPLPWRHYVEIAALATMGVLLLQDIARYMNWADLEFIMLRIYHVPLMLLALGLVIFDRYVGALRRVEQSAAELERRVAEKSREIEENHRRFEVVRREQALAVERQRILTDMHDGLGAILVTLLRQAESGRADRATIERGVKEALSEMRIAIDALQPRERDLGSVLGNLRFRLDESIRASGIALTWEVEQDTGLAVLQPSQVFALQRIVLEAITNALKHSGARNLRVAATASGGGRAEIVIADDGRGFGGEPGEDGLGLASMRERAAQIGASLEILSQPGQGTSVRVVISQWRAALAEAPTMPPLAAEIPP